MPTPSEQKALAFVALIILLGGAVRVVRAGSAASPTESEQQALDDQATAVDKAAVQSASRKHEKSTRKRMVTLKKLDTVTKSIGGVATVAPSFARPDQPFSHAPYSSATSKLGFPPPSPRIDVDFRTPSAAPGATTIDGGEKARVDLDVASEGEIDKLPRVGPATAKRIVANRDSFGPFKSLDGLRRVKGMGPATLQRLDKLVSFSDAVAPRTAH